MGTANGVLRTRTVRRRPEEQWWTSDCLDMVGGLPWKPNPSDDLGEEVIPAIDMPMVEPEVEIRRPEYCEGEIVSRRLYLRTRDFKEHGATRGCKGCMTMAIHEPRSHFFLSNKKTDYYFGKNPEGTSNEGSPMAK